MLNLDSSPLRIATSSTARDINRRVVLNLIRKHQPVSRAELARYSGLQPSTISAIAGELISGNWVREGSVDDIPRGRKPTSLYLNGERVRVFGVNVRPSVTNLAAANLDGELLIQETFTTPRTGEEFVREITCRIRETRSLYPDMIYEGLGVSLPGRVELPSQRFVFAPNLGWHCDDLKQQLEIAADLPVDIENEANACALAEFWFGKHTEGVRNLVVVAVSEGIGVGMIMNGQMVRGPSGLAGEFGHVAIVEDGLPCACGNQGCWEVYASNSAALRYYQPDISDASGAHHRGRFTPASNFDELVDLAEHGNPLACRAIDEMAQYLGMGIAMLVTGLAPDVIVVVGEITRMWDRVGPVVDRMIHERSFSHAATRVMPSGPAPIPRLRGIIALVLQKRFGTPVHL